MTDLRALVDVPAATATAQAEAPDVAHLADQAGELGSLA